MSSIFDPNGSFVSVLTKIFDLFVINLLWLICSLPIITIGPSTCALYYTVVKCVRRERGYVFKEFFHSFKSNFKQGTIIGIMNIFLFIVMYFNISLSLTPNSKTSTLTLAIYIAVSFIFYILFLYCYPNLSRFVLPIKNLFINSFLMSIRHFFSTIIMSVLLFGCIYALKLYPMAIFFLPVLCCLLISMVMERILVKYIPEEYKDENSWYNQ